MLNEDSVMKTENLENTVRQPEKEGKLGNSGDNSYLPTAVGGITNHLSNRSLGLSKISFGSIRSATSLGVRTSAYNIKNYPSLKNPY
jgi:hypothetical protein